MKQFVYKSAAAGLASWPSGELRLEGIPVTENPQDADVFVVPGSLSAFKDGLSVLDRLPHIAGRDDRLVCFDVSDNFVKALNRPWIILRCDARSWMLKDDPNTVQIGWPVEDYAECVALPPEGFKWDISFQGWLSSDARIDSSNACKNNPELKCDIEQYSDFTGYLHDRATNQWNPEGIRRRAEFRRSMRESRVALCPESIPGVFPYRFFEAMSAGRVPLLVGSEFVFPFEQEISYSDFVLTCPRAEAASADKIVQGFVRSYSDGEIAEMGKLARQAWEAWLDSRNWPRLHAHAVKQQLEARACASR